MADTFAAVLKVRRRARYTRPAPSEIWGGTAQVRRPESNHGSPSIASGQCLACRPATDTRCSVYGDGISCCARQARRAHGSTDVANFWKPTKASFDACDECMSRWLRQAADRARCGVGTSKTWGRKATSARSVPAYSQAGPRSKHFNTVHCAMVSNDGFVYVCDRVNDRIQVFRKDGTFVREALVDAHTFRSGSVWDMAFSKDAEQTYIYAANGVDQKINILLRSTLEVLTSFGDGGRGPGQFFGVHNLATDSQCNLYTFETYTGARVQRFLYKGVGPVTKGEQGVIRPKGVKE